MPRYALPVCFCIALLVCNSGCNTDPKKPGETVAVKGTVKLDGEPMSSGEIWFSVRGETVNVLPISKGSFEGKAHPGKNKVEVYAYKEGPPLTTDPKGAPTKINTIPSKYNGTESTLAAEVPAAGASDLKFDVSSK